MPLARMKASASVEWIGALSYSRTHRSGFSLHGSPGKNWFIVFNSPLRKSSQSSEFYEGGVGVVTECSTSSVQETTIIVEVLSITLRSRD